MCSSRASRRVVWYLHTKITLAFSSAFKKKFILSLFFLLPLFPLFSRRATSLVLVKKKRGASKKKEGVPFLKIFAADASTSATLQGRARPSFPHFNNAHKYTTMQSIAQVQNVQKINAVSTGKVANEKSMMVWRPHGNKYVSIPNFPSSRVFDF